MTRKRGSKRLVIDATVARSAGAKDFGESKDCREFLLAVLHVCHSAVLTSALEDEWARHQSLWAFTWRSGMVARKKLVSLGELRNDELRSKIENYVRAGAISQKDLRVMDKDIHLIETALACDRTVISLDEEARDAFGRAASRLGILKEVAWVNPAKDQGTVEWLAAGAKVRKAQLLGFESSESDSG